MSEHTPGPWEWSHTNDRYRHTIHVGIVEIAKTPRCHIDDHDENEANARLIAAAPELLEALEEAIYWDGYDDHGEPAVWLTKARVALTKAQGGQNATYSK
jgi:hypothetical protein